MLHQEVEAPDADSDAQSPSNLIASKAIWRNACRRLGAERIWETKIRLSKWDTCTEFDHELCTSLNFRSFSNFNYWISMMRRVQRVCLKFAYPQLKNASIFWHLLCFSFSSYSMEIIFEKCTYGICSAWNSYCGWILEKKISQGSSANIVYIALHLTVSFTVCIVWYILLAHAQKVYFAIRASKFWQIPLFSFTNPSM